MNLIINLVGVLVIDINIEREKQHDNEGVMLRLRNFFMWGQVPVDLLIMTVWIAVYWQGTTFEKLFSSRNMKTLLSLGAINISLNFWFMVDSYTNLDVDAKEICIIILCVFLCECSIYSRYYMMSQRPKFYHEAMKQFDTKPDKQLNLEEAVKSRIFKGKEIPSSAFLSTPKMFKKNLTEKFDINASFEKGSV